MDPRELGEKYNRISRIYHQEMDGSDYGLAQLKRAINYCGKPGLVLDVGCGPGGRIIKLLKSAGFSVRGIDVSASMIQLAKTSHPEFDFEVADICKYETKTRFEFIVAWDSLFHLPLAAHKTVLRKLASLLAPGGILIYTFGNTQGEHTDTWHNDTFYYSSIGINQNLETLTSCGLCVLHLELDQYPEKHVYAIAKKL